VDCSGKPLVRAPRWTGTAGYVHSFDLGDQGSLDASFNAQFASASYLAQDFLQSERQKAYVLGDFDLTYTTSNQNWAISVFVHNIGNQAVANQAFHYPFASAANPLLNNPDGANFVTLRAPRTFGGRLRYNF
jgi:iron complex outermembrane receptor protein